MPITTYTSERLTRIINGLVTTKQLSYLDAVLHFCETKQLEPETIAPLLSDRIRSELALDAQRLHFIPKADSLQF